MVRVFLILSLALFAMSSSVMNDSGRWVIDPGSQLFIHGSTNINNFKCGIECYNEADTLEYQIQSAKQQLQFSKSQMTVPVKSFTCGNDLITKDFKNTLQANRYPDIKIQFLTLTNFITSPGRKTVNGNVSITLAGETKKYNLILLVEQDGKGAITLAGKQTVCFADFNLTAPKKMLGVIQVQEDLIVEFNLKLRELQAPLFTKGTSGN